MKEFARRSRLVLALGVVCLVSLNCDRSRPAKAQEPTQQTQVTNQSFVRSVATNVLEELQTRADQGEPEAQYDLGERCSKGNGVPMDHERAATWYRKAAEHGLAKAQAALGNCYAKGDGVAQDYDQALSWSQKAAEQGNAEGQAALGWCYLVGRGVRQDFAKAQEWTGKAVAQGSARGQNNLGVSFAKGQGVKQDYTEAAKWYRKAAEQGYALAQWNLGVSCSKGHGVTQDYCEAYKWFRKSAEQGLAKAQFAVGLSFSEGRGVPQDYVEAVKWYRKAAAQGDAGAQCNLGLGFANGRGVPRDYAEAYKWCDLAMAQAKPADLIKCEAVFAPPAKVPLVILNGTSIECGRSALVGTPAGTVKVTCVKIEKEAAQILIEGADQIKIVEPVLKGKAANPFQAAQRLRTFLERRATHDQIAEGQHRASVFAAKKEDDGAAFDDTWPVPGNRKGKMVAGTGFFISDDGYLVTCEHVVRGETSFQVRASGSSYTAKLIKKDRAIDAAVLKVNGTFQALPIVQDCRVKLGDSAFTIGFPNPMVQGVEPKLTRGEISSMAGIRDNPRYFQISVPVQPGNSGGALVDECGNVVGVVAARLDDVAGYETSGALPQNVNYAVKGNLVRDFLDTVPELAGKLKPPRTAKDRQTASATAERAAVLVVAE